MIKFTLNIAPMSLQSSGKRMDTRGPVPRYFKTAKAKNYQTMIKILSAPYRPEQPFSGPVVVDFIFIVPRPGRLMRKSDPDGLIPCPCQPDRDNFQKGTQDALVGFWLNDGQIYDGRTAKFYAEKGGEPRIIVSIKGNAFFTNPSPATEKNNEQP